MNFRDRRLPCRFDVAVKSPIGATTGQILNVTRKGARIAGLPRYQPAEKVSLTVLNSEVTGTVMWQTGQLTGIAFETALTDRQFDAIRKPKSLPVKNRKIRKVHSFQEIG